MANHQIPRTARCIEKVHGIDDDGNVVTVKAYQHTRAGHARPDFYVLWYRELNRRLDRSSRVTRQFTGASGRARLDAEMTATRALLAGSVQRAHAAAATGQA